MSGDEAVGLGGKGSVGWRVPLAILTVFVGCASNVVFLELLVKNDAGVGNLVTFSSFLFISVEGFFGVAGMGRVQPKVPMKAYGILVTMYFAVSVVNNYALNFDIPMPLHMIFRAGSLIANMILGILLLKKSYSLTKYVSVVGISIGIALCTIMSSSASASSASDSSAASWASFAVGIFMLTFALFMSARMGIYQEVIYAEHGKHPKEALFYSHALPLPGFILLAGNIQEHFAIAAASQPMDLMGFQAPSMLVYLALNTLTQYICISAVFILTTECASLTVTLVLTLRKFCSLLFSIWYFQNSFTLYHWVGTVMVFAGTLCFTLIKDKDTKTLKVKAN